MKRALLLPPILLLPYAITLFSLRHAWQQEQPIVELITANGSVSYHNAIGPPWLSKIVPPNFRHWLQRVDVARLQADGFDDDSVRRLTALRHAREMRFMNTGFTADALDALVEMPKLEFLTFQADAISDEKLKRLQSFPRLRQIVLIAPNVSDAALEEFRKARPNVSVVIE